MVGGSFRKTRSPGSASDASAADADFFAAEAAGLRWLAAAGAPVVAVLSVSVEAIELQALTSAPPSAAAAREFGARLARMHDAGAASFGAPPMGYHGRQFIGNRPLATGDYLQWGEFYAATRVLPYLEPALDAGYLQPAEAELVRRACAVIADGAFDDADPPSRIHGDLWTGNLMWTRQGAVMIDPAAHGGHRETDLAMLTLFGCPHLGEIISGYHAQHPLRPGVEQRVPLHQLHPLAVHAAGHGRSYGVALTDAAQAVLSLAG